MSNGSDELHHTSPDNSTVIWKVAFDLDTDVDRIINSVNFWIQAILVRLGPCFILTVLSALLVRTMTLGLPDL